jgi:hypothetical protein
MVKERLWLSVLDQSTLLTMPKEVDANPSRDFSLVVGSRLVALTWQD